MFVEVVRVAREMGVVRFGKLSIDGTKVRASASKRKAMSYERMLKEEAAVGAGDVGDAHGTEEGQELVLEHRAVALAGGGLPAAGLAVKELAGEVAEQGSGLALDLGGLDCGDGSIAGLGGRQFLRRAEGEVDSVQPALHADEEGPRFVGRDLEAERRQGVVKDDEQTLPVPGLHELAAVCLARSSGRESGPTGSRS